MRFLRHNRRAALLIAAGLAVAVVAVVLLVRGSDSPTSGNNSVTGTAPSAGSTTGSTAASSVPLPKAGKKKAPRRKAAATTPTPASGGGPGRSASGLTGFTGSGYSKDAPRHTITLTVTSAQSAATAVGWWVPTDPDTKTGNAKYVGASWSHIAHAYGPPGYARLLVIAGGEGIPTTCTIKVDGRVVDRRTTAHAYGQVLCQG